MKRFLAFDLGAESGRAMLGSLDGGRLDLEELHRFPNIPVKVFSALYWDPLRLFAEVQRALALAGRERKLSLDGIGVDTWGVDCALLGEDGALIENPRHYRDPRNNGMPEAVFERVSRDRVFAQTGLQVMQINTLYQLYGMKLAASPALRNARSLLFIPDLFNYWLTGAIRNELTIASTSQFYNPRERRWATELLAELGLPAGLLGQMVPPGTLLGPLLEDLAATAGLDAPPVYAAAGHDTASAVAAVPAAGRDWCYISSGTWSLMGAEVDEPVIDERSLRMNMTNEVGVEGKIRLLKNIAGLWLLQECRRAWALDGAEYTYEELVRMAADARPFAAVLDPDAFLEPGGMPGKIAAYCRRTAQPAPQSPGEFARAILESLALKYLQVLEMLEELLGRRIEVIHIVGGGSRNALLNQFAADATGRMVLAGPSEATAAGNILVQAVGSGAVRDLAAARAVVRASFGITKFEPGRRAGWPDAYARFLSLAR